MPKNKLVERIQVTNRLKAASTLLEDRDLHRLPVVYGNNSYFLTKDAMWTGYSVPPKNAGFLSTRRRQQNFEDANNWFKSFPSGEENSGQILIVNHTQTAEEWERKLLEKQKALADDEGRVLPDGFAQYVKLTRMAIDEQEFFRRDIFLFVKNGDRSDWKGGIKGFLENFGRLLTSGFGIDESQPLEDEKKQYDERSDQVNKVFADSWIDARSLRRSRVEWIVRYLDSLGAPTPDVAAADEQEWGIGRWQTSMSSWTRKENLGKDSDNNNITAVKFITTKGEGISYAVMMPVIITPNDILPFSNWLFSASTVDFPVDVSLRFEIVDPTRAEKELDKPLDAARAQAMEETESGRELDEATQQQRAQLEQVKVNTIRRREPIAIWSCTFAVYDTDPVAVKKKARELRSHFEGLHLTLDAPPADQRTLFYEMFPGGELIVKDWVQRTNTNFLAASMPWLETAVGSPIEEPALYQGFTIIAEGRTAKKGSPVFFDLVSIADEEGRAPTEFVCGDPGSGKTVSRGLKSVHENGLKGVTQFVWDPKGDFKPIKESASKLLLDPNKINLIDLGSQGIETTISLDGFAIAEFDPKNDIDDRITSGIDVISGLSQKLQKNNPYISEIITEAVRNTVEAADAEGRQPKMMDVLTLLTRWSTSNFSGEQAIYRRSSEVKRRFADGASSLVRHLETVNKNSLGKILFRDPDQGTLQVAAGTTTIFNAISLREVNPDADPAEESIDTSISRVIQEMMTSYIRSLLYRLPDTVTKAVYFDEWHVIRRSDAAARLLDWLKRMGRSKRTSVTYLSQSALDSGGGTLNSIWCGKCETEDNARASCRLLQIEESDYNIKTLTNLTAGEFIFRDYQQHVGRVRIDFWDQDVLDIFNTQAAAKAAREGRERAAVAEGDYIDLDSEEFDISEFDAMEDD